MMVLFLQLAILPCVLADVPPPKHQPEAEPAPEGRLLYANDDDWDWASPKSIAAEKRSGLSRYGAMEWSALDMMEEDLPIVQGMVVGTLPSDNLSLEQLNELRAKGNVKPYREVPFEAGIFPGLLREDAPNIIILMQHKPSSHRLNEDDIAALARYVRRGGRLLILDDWGIYKKALDQIIKKPRPKTAAEKIDPMKLERALGLVALLGHDRFMVRSKATRDLITMGKKILPVLHDYEADDPEIALRIRSVIMTLDPPGPRFLRTMSDESMKDLHTSLEISSRDVEILPIKRNAQGKPGSALVVRFPPAEIAPVGSAVP